MISDKSETFVTYKQNTQQHMTMSELQYIRGRMIVSWKDYKFMDINSVYLYLNMVSEMKQVYYM